MSAPFIDQAAARCYHYRFFNFLRILIFGLMRFNANLYASINAYFKWAIFSLVEIVAYCNTNILTP